MLFMSLRNVRVQTSCMMACMGLPQNAIDALRQRPGCPDCTNRHARALMVLVCAFSIKQLSTLQGC